MLKELDQEKGDVQRNTSQCSAGSGCGGPGRRGPTPVTGAPPTPPESLRQARAEQHDAGTDHA
ncbi:hypothetical protein, partial [Stenotrophomonas maltophilia]|uniref:hypothetical protein n=1 Tax=Stenotrophomonas maltophilia TaxID=40324 RepID=UPI0019539F55